jgi:hypothetical protein
LAHSALLLAVGAATLIGCGSDDGDGDATADTSAQATTTVSETGANEELCSSYTEVTAAFSSDGPPDAEALGKRLDALESDAPDEIAEPLGVMIDAARTTLESGGEDSSAFESPEFGEAMAQVDPYMFENCDFDAKVEVVAKEYSFGGIPQEMDAGTAAFLLTNEGDEAHELALMRKADGVTQSWDEILAMDEAEAEELVEQVGGTFAASKGDAGMAIADLQPGEYIALCFVPSGTTVDDSGEHAGDGPPHFMQGMQSEFTVT